MPDVILIFSAGHGYLRDAQWKKVIDILQPKSAHVCRNAEKNGFVIIIGPVAQNYVTFNRLTVS